MDFFKRGRPRFTRKYILFWHPGYVISCTWSMLKNNVASITKKRGSWSGVGNVLSVILSSKLPRSYRRTLKNKQRVVLVLFHQPGVWQSSLDHFCTIENVTVISCLFCEFDWDCFCFPTFGNTSRSDAICENIDRELRGQRSLLLQSQQECTFRKNLN